MLDLTFKCLDGGQNAPFHNIVSPNDAPMDSKTQLLTIKATPTVLEGQVPCHESLLLSLNYQ